MNAHKKIYVLLLGITFRKFRLVRLLFYQFAANIPSFLNGNQCVIYGENDINII